MLNTYKKKHWLDNEMHFITRKKKYTQEDKTTKILKSKTIVCLSIKLHQFVFMF